MYECGPNNRQDLESIQNQILERIQYLREKGIPLSEDWALDDLWKATEQTQRIINENRFQIDTYYYQIDDLTTRLQAVEEELNSLLSDRKWN